MLAVDIVDFGEAGMANCLFVLDECHIQVKLYMGNLRFMGRFCPIFCKNPAGIQGQRAAVHDPGSGRDSQRRGRERFKVYA